MLHITAAGLFWHLTLPANGMLVAVMSMTMGTSTLLKSLLQPIPAVEKV
jgi:hypothetical protein